MANEVSFMGTISNHLQCVHLRYIISLCTPVVSDRIYTRNIIKTAESIHYVLNYYWSLVHFFFYPKPDIMPQYCIHRLHYNFAPRDQEAVQYNLPFHCPRGKTPFYKISTIASFWHKQVTSSYLSQTSDKHYLLPKRTHWNVAPTCHAVKARQRQASSLFVVVQIEKLFPPQKKSTLWKPSACPTDKARHATYISHIPTYNATLWKLSHNTSQNTVFPESVPTCWWCFHFIHSQVIRIIYYRNM